MSHGSTSQPSSISNNNNNNNSASMQEDIELDTPRDTVRQGRLPHYAVPNISYLLPDYSNQEAEVVKQVFLPNNFFTLHTTLPAVVFPDFRMVSRRSRVQQMKGSGALFSVGEFLDPGVAAGPRRHRVSSAAATAADQHRPGSLSDGDATGKSPTASSHGARPLSPASPGRFSPKREAFSVFEYIPSEFDLADSVRSLERRLSEAKVVAAGHPRPFSPAGFAAEDASWKPTTDYVSSPVNLAKEQMSRERKLQQSKSIAPSAFRPGGSHHVLDGFSRAMLPDILKRLLRDISSDFRNYDIAVFVDDHDRIFVEFQLGLPLSLAGDVRLDQLPTEGVPNAAGPLTTIRCYMNIFAGTHPLMFEHRMIKDVHCWAQTSSLETDGDRQFVVFFAFVPPWARAKLAQLHHQHLFGKNRPSTGQRQQHNFLDLSLPVSLSGSCASNRLTSHRQSLAPGGGASVVPFPAAGQAPHEPAGSEAPAAATVVAGGAALATANDEAPASVDGPLHPSDLS